MIKKKSIYNQNKKEQQRIIHSGQLFFHGDIDALKKRLLQQDESFPNRQEHECNEKK